MGRSPWLVYRLARKVAVSVVGGVGGVGGGGDVRHTRAGAGGDSAGLAILATEYVWAQRWLERMRQETIRAVRAVRDGFEGGRAPGPLAPDAKPGDGATAGQGPE